MKKSLKFCVCGLVAAVLASGCSAKTDSPAESTAAETTAGTEETKESEKETPAALGNPGEVTSLAEYKGVSYVPQDTEITDEDVEARIQNLLDANPEIREADREAKDGDIVNIDYVGTKDGVAFDGGTAEGYDLTLGSGQFIDGFEEGLVGAKKGEKVSLNLTFPEGYPSEDLAGQDVVFDVTVNKVQESVDAELNDAFIAANTDSSTVDEYRKAVREEMEDEAQINADNQKKADVFLKVVDGSEVDVSEEAITAYYEQQYGTYEQQAQMYGMDMETMVGYMGMDMESFENDLKEMSREGCKQTAVVNAIAAAENLTVEDKDKETLAADFGYADVASMIINVGEDTVNNYILTEKVVQFIADNAVAES